MKPLVILELLQGQLSRSTLSAISAGLFWQPQVDVVLFADGSDEVAAVVTTLTRVPSVCQLWLVTDPKLQQRAPQWYVAQLMSLVPQYEVVLAAATSWGKALVPMLAAKQGCNAYADVIALEDERRLVRPTYAGNVWQTVDVLSPQLFLTVRASAFSPVSLASDETHTAKVHPLNCVEDPVDIQVISRKPSSDQRPALTQADCVVAGGRGFKDKTGFDLVLQLADCLHAAVAATRAAVDAGFIENEHQVGQTGQVVAPKLYLALGLSGAIQHVSGMKDSDTIIAVNNDADAPIFQIADYGLVGDVFEVVPKLIEHFSGE